VGVVFLRVHVHVVGRFGGANRDLFRWFLCIGNVMSVVVVTIGARLPFADLGEDVIGFVVFPVLVTKTVCPFVRAVDTCSRCS
jgi:hypothetical protein